MRTVDVGWKDSVELVFWSFSRWTDESVGRQFLESLLRFGFVPEKFGDEDPPRLRFGSGSADVLLRLWATRSDQLIILGSKSVDFQAILHLNAGKGEIPHSLHFLVHDEYFDDKRNATKFLDLAESLYRLLKPVEGEIGHRKDRESKLVVEKFMEVSGRKVLTKTYIPANPISGLPGIYWANFLGPVYVDFFSKARIDSAPSFQKKPLQDGGYLLLTSEGPLDYARAETKKLEHALFVHLGSESFIEPANPKRIAKTPFTPSRDAHASPNSTGLTGPTGKKPLEKRSSIRQCPECGESVRITKVTDDPVNNLIGFRCLKCGALWAVEKSLIH